MNKYNIIIIIYLYNSNRQVGIVPSLLPASVDEKTDVKNLSNLQGQRITSQ